MKRADWVLPNIAFTADDRVCLLPTKPVNVTMRSLIREILTTSMTSAWNCLKSPDWFFVKIDDKIQPEAGVARPQGGHSDSDKAEKSFIHRNPKKDSEMSSHKRPMRTRQLVCERGCTNGTKSKGHQWSPSERRPTPLRVSNAKFRRDRLDLVLVLVPLSFKAT